MNVGNVPRIRTRNKLDDLRNSNNVFKLLWLKMPLMYRYILVYKWDFEDVILKQKLASTNRGVMIL